MANYFVINRPSNLIIGVACTSYTPQDSKIKRFVVAGEKSLNTYYKLIRKNPDAHIDVGELMVMSEYFRDKVKETVPFNDEGKALPQKVRYRSPESYPEAPDRESLIFSWIASRPDADADAYDLNDAFCMGMLSARAYLEKYNLTK